MRLPRLVAPAAFILLLLMYVALNMVQRMRMSADVSFLMMKTRYERLPEDLPVLNKSLRFQVCNGMTNQRLAVVYGILIAKKARREPVLPQLITDGLQRTGANVKAAEGNSIAFGEIYDEPYFKRRLAKEGIRILGEHEAPPASQYSVQTVRQMNPFLQTLTTSYDSHQHIYLDCLLFSLQASDITEEDEHLMWTILDAMRPVQSIQAIVDFAVSTLAKMGPNGLYNFIHFRIESDWIEHCLRWSTINDGNVRDNCYNNTEEIDTMLKLFGFRNDIPLYVATFWDAVDEKGGGKAALDRLVSSGFQVVTDKVIFTDLSSNMLHTIGREQRAVVEYFVGLKSHRYIGNSVSTFSALAICERRHVNKWAAYYNGGNIPISSYLPTLFKMPWVFTYNSFSKDYDYLLKAAVASASVFGTLKPYCIFMGDETSTIYAWLKKQGVTLVHHEPSWRNELLSLDNMAKDNIKHSHLYATHDMLISTFQRVDLPVIPVLEQYTYVLYTDADVYFRKRITLNDFVLPLPKSISMAWEMTPTFPYNAGVFLGNLPIMRINYEAFIKMMLNKTGNQGLYYANFGPADQGILNKFYENDLRAQILDQAFNAKPYDVLNLQSLIVHWHGPKPLDYLDFIDKGTCRFADLCKRGVMKSMCTYISEWSQYIPEEPIAMELSSVCDLLGKVWLQRIFKEKAG